MWMFVCFFCSRNLNYNWIIETYGGASNTSRTHHAYRLYIRWKTEKKRVMKIDHLNDFFFVLHFNVFMFSFFFKFFVYSFRTVFIFTRFAQKLIFIFYSQHQSNRKCLFVWFLFFLTCGLPNRPKMKMK